MKRQIPIAMLMLALLAGCEFRTKGDSADAAPSVKTAGGPEIEEGLTIDTPLFEGKINLPGVSLASNMDLDGIELHPGSKVVGINVDAHEEGKPGEVRIGFTSDAPTAAVLDHYRRSATNAGFTLAPPGGASSLHGTKDDTTFDLTLAASGTGTTGTIVMGGS